MADTPDIPSSQSRLLPEPLRVTSTSLLQLLQLSPDALVIVDRAGQMVMLNEHAAALFGYQQEELRGQLLEVLLPRRLRKTHVSHRDHYVSAPLPRPMGAGLPLLGLRKDGSEFPLDISLRPFLLDEHLHTIGAIRDMTDQRRLERQRAQQIEHIRLQTELIHQAHDAILVCDRINRVLSWNRGAEELYGWTAQEALGRATHTLLKTRFPVSLAALETQLERNGRWDGELIHTRRDGSTVVVESRQVFFQDEEGQPSAILEINRDITERGRQEQTAQATHAEVAARLSLLQQVLDAMPSSVYLVYGSDARLLLANQATSKLLGASWRPHQPMLEYLSAHGIRIFDVQGRPLPPDQFATLRAVQDGKTVLQQQETIRHPDGSGLPVLVNAVALPPQEVQHSWQQETAQQVPAPERLALVIHQDVTALKEAEYLKDEFVGVAAHELRTPIAVLKGFAQTLIVQTKRGKGAPLAEWQLEALEEIDQATRRLVELIEDLLEVTRLQAGRLTLHREPTDLVALVQRVVRRLHMTAEQHRLSIETTCTHLVLHLDAQRIEQVLSNLIGNAIKYSLDEGAIEIVLREEGDAHRVVLSVRDHGIGIPTQQQASIFGRFMRADNARAYGIGGTGLGLYLSRELVELHGGRIWFESTEGQGSTFFLALPIGSE
jgi:PAS domain S-box-containing protein